MSCYWWALKNIWNHHLEHVFIPRPPLALFFSKVGAIFSSLLALGFCPRLSVVIQIFRMSAGTQVAISTIKISLDFLAQNLGLKKHKSKNHQNMRGWFWFVLDPFRLVEKGGADCSFVVGKILKENLDFWTINWKKTFLFEKRFHPYRGPYLALTNQTGKFLTSQWGGWNIPPFVIVWRIEWPILSGSPPSTVKCFQDQVILTQRKTHTTKCKTVSGNVLIQSSIFWRYLWRSSSDCFWKFLFWCWKRT